MHVCFEFLLFLHVCTAYTHTHTVVLIIVLCTAGTIQRHRLIRSSPADSLTDRDTRGGFVVFWFYSWKSIKKFSEDEVACLLFSSSSSLSIRLKDLIVSHPKDPSGVLHKNLKPKRRKTVKFWNHSDFYYSVTDWLEFLFWAWFPISSWSGLVLKAWI